MTEKPSVLGANNNNNMEIFFVTAVLLTAVLYFCAYAVRQDVGNIKCELLIMRHKKFRHEKNEKKSPATSIMSLRISFSFDFLH